MKKFLKWTGIVVGVLVVVALLVPLALPSTVHVERSIEIRSLPASVYAVVSDFNQSAKWDPWASKDPNIETKVIGSGVGSTYTWNGNDEVGEGRSTILAAEPPEGDTPGYVKLELHMVRPMEDSFTSDWKLESVNGRTKATWGFDNDLGYFQRYFAPMIDGFIGPDFEQGLRNLKSYVENQAPAVKPPTVKPAEKPTESPSTPPAQP